jgi:hypothetical protein
MKSNHKRITLTYKPPSNLFNPSLLKDDLLIFGESEKDAGIYDVIMPDLLISNYPETYLALSNYVHRQSNLDSSSMALIEYLLGECKRRLSQSELAISHYTLAIESAKVKGSKVLLSFLYYMRAREYGALDQWVYCFRDLALVESLKVKKFCKMAVEFYTETQTDALNSLRVHGLMIAGLQHIKGSSIHLIESAMVSVSFSTSIKLVTQAVQENRENPYAYWVRAVMSLKNALYYNSEMKQQGIVNDLKPCASA